MSTAGVPVELANNWLAAEPHIVGRLKAALAGLRPAVQVLTRKDLAGVKESAQHVPAVHVVYAGTRVVEHQHNATRYAHKWLVVAAVRNVATTVSNEAARADAGVLLERAVNALMGESLPGVAGAFEPVTPPTPGNGEGYMYLPAAFEIATVFRKH